VRACGEPLQHRGGERRGAEVDRAQGRVRPRRRSPAACASLPCAAPGTCGPG
jgi:hypothetical protein